MLCASFAMNQLIQHIIVQDQDGQNNNIVVFVLVGLGYATKPTEDVRTTKGLQERTRIIEWDDGDT